MKKLFSYWENSFFIFPALHLITNDSLENRSIQTIISMRNTFTLLLALFLGLSTLSLSAQDAVKDFNFNMSEETRQMSRATANAFVLTWPKADPDMVGKAWKKYARGLGGKLNYDRRANEYFVDNAEVKGLENAVDITTKTSKVGDGTEMTFWFNGGVTYIEANANPEAFVAAEKLMRDFDSYVYAEIMREQIKEEEKVLKKMERDMRKEKREINREERDIKKAERDIDKAQKEIDESQREIADTKASISEQEAKEAQQKKMIEMMRQRIKAVR